MKVTVRIFGELTIILGNRHTLEFDESTTVGRLVSRLARMSGQTVPGFLGEHRVDGRDIAILVNGRNTKLLEGQQTKIEDGDEVVFLIPTSGG
jgi:molybdopterin converting factor small subunit